MVRADRIAPLACYAELDRTHPIEGQLRAAWTAQALALTGALAAGHADQAAGELALATTLAIGGVGALFALAGGGLVWVSFACGGRSRRAATTTPDAARARVKPSGKQPAAGPSPSSHG